MVGSLAVQLGQSLALIVGVQVFLDPGADTGLGLPSSGGLVDLLVFLALLWILIKIPIWTTRIVLGRRPFGSTTAGYMIKSAITWKAYGWARGLRLPKKLAAKQVRLRVGTRGRCRRVGRADGHRGWRFAVGR